MEETFFLRALNSAFGLASRLATLERGTCSAALINRRLPAKMTTQATARNLAFRLIAMGLFM